MYSFFYYRTGHPRDLPSFPTRRPSDLYSTDEDLALTINAPGVLANDTDAEGSTLSAVLARTDRKSTRLNSSHLGISYAVFCLKKKKITSNKQNELTSAHTVK